MPSIEDLIPNLTLEQQFEYRKIEIELQKLSVEKSKLKWTLLAGISPFVAVAATLALGLWSLNAQSESNFKLEIIKSIIQSTNAGDLMGRARLYKSIFPDETKSIPTIDEAYLAKAGFKKSVEPQLKFGAMNIISSKMPPKSAVDFWLAEYPALLSKNATDVVNRDSIPPGFGRADGQPR